MFRQRCCSLLAMVLCSTVCVYAQSERPYGVFVGYSNLRAEGLRNTNDFLDRRLPMNGLNGSATLFALGSIGVTGDVSWNRNRNSVDVTNGTDSNHTDVLYFMGGPSYSVAVSEHFQPFARILGGIARTNFQAKQERSVNDQNRTTTFGVGSTDWAMAFGGGLDVKVSERFHVRAIQFDWAPVFFDDHAITVLGTPGVLRPAFLDGKRQDNFRFSFGVTF
jgi:opacity protein-like surface antigen